MISLVCTNLLTGGQFDCPRWFYFNIPGEGCIHGMGLASKKADGIKEGMKDRLVFYVGSERWMVLEERSVMFW